MALSKPLAPSKLYHCSIYYNYFEGHQSRRDEDHKLSYEFVCHLKTKLFEIGRTKVRYFDDLPPGVNLFEELFSNMMVNAEKIVVIFTKGFNESHWHKLTHQNTFKELLDKKESNNLLGISICLDKTVLSKELGVCVQNLVYFDDDWQNDDENWSLISRFFLEERPIHELPQRLLSQTPVQESSGDILATDGVNASIKVDGAGEANSQSVDSDGLKETPSNSTEKEDHKQDTAVQESDGDIIETDSGYASIEVGGAGEANSHIVDSGELAANSPETVPDTISMRVPLQEASSIADEISLSHDAPSISVKSARRENTNSTEKEDHKQDSAGLLSRVWSFVNWATKNVSL